MDITNTDLPNLINVIYNLMATNEAHNLPSPNRIILYQLIKEKSDNYLDIWAWLAVLSAKSVLPIWENNVTGRFRGTQIKDMVDLAEDYLQNKVSYEFAYKKFVDEYHPFVGHLYIATEVEVPFFAKKACNAAYEALAITLGTEPFNGLQDQRLSYGLTNETTEPMGDAASSAVTAIIYQLPVTANPLIKIRRREFWEWWLLEAIPQAWDLATTTKLQPKKACSS